MKQVLRNKWRYWFPDGFNLKQLKANFNLLIRRYKCTECGKHTFWWKYVEIYRTQNASYIFPICKNCLKKEKLDFAEKIKKLMEEGGEQSAEEMEA